MLSYDSLQCDSVYCDILADTTQHILMLLFMASQHREAGIMHPSDALSDAF